MFRLVWWHEGKVLSVSEFATSGHARASLHALWPTVDDPLVTAHLLDDEGQLLMERKVGALPTVSLRGDAIASIRRSGT